MTVNVNANEAELGAGIIPATLTDEQVSAMLDALIRTPPTAPVSAVSRNVRALTVLAALIAERHAAALALKAEADARLAAAERREQDADVAGLLARLAPAPAPRKGWFK